MAIITISDPVSQGGWGIVEGATNGDTRAINNSKKFICKFRDTLNNGDIIQLDPGVYEFNMIYFQTKDNIEFRTSPNTNGTATIKQKSVSGRQSVTCANNTITWQGAHCWIKISNTDDFFIHDLIIDGRKANVNGGLMTKGGATNGRIENIKVYDTERISLVIDGNGAGTTYNITVNNCEAWGQRTWDTSAKAMIIAGGGADNITFDNCTSKAQSKYGSYISPANLLGCDNATNIEFRNCEATGASNTPGSTTGFWQEGNNQASAELHNCSFTKTDGAIGQAESPANPQGSGNLDLKAYNCYIDDSSARTSQPWAAWSQGLVNVFELYNCIFNNNGNTNRVNTNIFHGGGIHFGGGGSSLIKDCTFQNTDSGYNVTWFGTDNQCVQECMSQGNTRQYCENVVCAQPSTEYTLENNVFDANLRTHDRGVVNGIVYENWNTLTNGAQYMEGNGTDWEWIHQTDGGIKSATTTVINTPTSNATVGVYYDSHTTYVQYSSGDLFNDMLYKMRSAIYNDSSAKITAYINIVDATITFVQKSGASGNYISFEVDFDEWQNGQPFSDMYLSMQ